MGLRMILLIILLTVLVAACDALPGNSDAAVNPSAEPIESPSTEESMSEAATDEAHSADMAEEAMTEEAMTEEAMTEEAMTEEAMTEEAMPADESSDASNEGATLAYAGADWASLQLVDARTGASFTLADYAGRTVFVEPMATWCSNCRAQQRQVAQAIPELDADSFVFISLSVEGNLPNASLAEYADQNAFDWLFVVATPELTEALITQFGRSVVNPPATPHFTIAPDGRVSALSTGSHSAQQLIAELLSVSS